MSSKLTSTTLTVTGKRTSPYETKALSEWIDIKTIVFRFYPLTKPLFWGDILYLLIQQGLGTENTNRVTLGDRSQGPEDNLKIEFTQSKIWLRLGGKCFIFIIIQNTMSIIDP